MTLGLPIPSHYVVPTERFDRSLGPNEGINVAEFEFPAYYNFFFKKQRLTLVVDSKDVENRIRRVMQGKGIVKLLTTLETLLGPKEMNIEEDFVASYPRDKIPHTNKELAYFRRFGDSLIEIDTLLEFKVFQQDKKGRRFVKLDDTVELIECEDDYEVHEGGLLVARVRRVVLISLEKWISSVFLYGSL